MKSYNVSDIFLSYKEVRALKKCSKVDITKQLKHNERLLHYGLIQFNYVQNVPGNMPVSDSSFSITEFGINYLLYRKEKMFLKKLPVVISLIALVSSFRHEILLLAQSVVQLMKNIVGI